MDEEKRFIEIDFRIVEPDGDEYKHYQKINAEISDTGDADIYFLYERFREFLRGFGFNEELVNRIQYIEENEIG